MRASRSPTHLLTLLLYILPHHRQSVLDNVCELPIVYPVVRHVFRPRLTGQWVARSRRLSSPLELKSSSALIRRQSLFIDFASLSPALPQPTT